MADKPIHTDRMDETLLQCWQALKPLPEGIQLIGGTAIMLYLNHRHSTDFDFVGPPGLITQSFVPNFVAFQDAGRIINVRGADRGAVDCILQPHRGNRDIDMNFLAYGVLVPPFTGRPKTAPNGVAVASPVDLCAMKLAAIRSRAKARDYEDLAAITIHWPNRLKIAIEHLQRRNRFLAKEATEALASPPPEVAKKLDDKIIKQLQEFIINRDRGLER